MSAGVEASIEGRDGLLSSECRGEHGFGAAMEGMDMDTGVHVGCSETSGVVGGDMTGASVEGRGEGAGCSCLAESPLSRAGLAVGGGAGLSGGGGAGLAGGGGAGLSGGGSAGLAGGGSAGLSGGGRAGLSGREPKSDEALESDLSAPLFTAFASRSCSLEFGRLREALRDAAGSQHSPRPNHTPAAPTWLDGELPVCSCLLGNVVLCCRIGALCLGASLGLFGENRVQPRLEARYGAVPPAFPAHCAAGAVVSASNRVGGHPGSSAEVHRALVLRLALFMVEAGQGPAVTLLVARGGYAEVSRGM